MPKRDAENADLKGLIMIILVFPSGYQIEEII